MPYPQAGFQVILLSLNDTRNGGKKTLYWQLKNKKDKWSISHRIIFSLEGIWCENVFMSQLQEVCRLRFVRHSSTLSKDGWITSWRRREWGGDRLIGVRSTDRQEEVKRDRQTDRRGEKPKETLEDMAWVNKVGVGDISICLWVWTRQGDRVLQWAAVGWKTTDRMSHSGTTWRSPSSSLASACLVCLSVLSVCLWPCDSVWETNWLRVHRGANSDLPFKRDL